MLTLSAEYFPLRALVLKKQKGVILFGKKDDVGFLCLICFGVQMLVANVNIKHLGSVPFKNLGFNVCLL